MTTTTSDPTIMEAIEQLRDEHIAAVNAGDIEAATNLFAPAAISLPPGAPALKGTDAIRAWFAQVFSGFRLQDFAIDPGGVEQHGEVAIEHGSWKATFVPKDAPSGMPGEGTYLTVYSRMPDGSVRIIRDTFNGLPG